MPELNTLRIKAKAYFLALSGRIKVWLSGLPGKIWSSITDTKQWKKGLKYGFWGFLGLCGILQVLFLFTWMGVFGALPSKEVLSTIRQPEASKIYSADGKLMGKYYTKNRNNLKFEDIPPAFMSSLIATEDSRFWTHTGIDFKSWMRVLIKGFILGQESAGGGSTLSQQLAKNLFPRKNYWAGSMLINKYREWITATRLEQAYSKEEILTFYINTVSFGENIFGLDAAADRYFSKSADQLALEECAMLIGLLKATGYYNPRNNPDRALVRRNVVLHRMHTNGVIDSLTMDSLRTLPLLLSYQRNTDSEGIALYFRNHLRPILFEWCANHFKANGEPYNLNTDGLKIYTSIDFGIQQYAEEALKTHMARLQEMFDKQFTDWSPYSAPIKDAKERLSLYTRLKKEGLTEDQIQDSMEVRIPMKFWTWEGMKDTVASPMDSIRHSLKILQGAVVVIHPRTGGVLAWVGGNDGQQFNIDYVLTPRHPGSAFKPFLYATALDQGMDPCTYYANQLISYSAYEGWTPGNADGQYGGIYSLPGALAKSINTIAVQLIFDTGIEAVVQKARRMGMKGEMKPVPSLALGTAEVTLMELTNAYITFLNKGSFRPYHLITRIEDQDGTILEEFKSPLTTSVYSPETSGLICQMLANVVDRGTAANLRYKELGIRGALAGKTGTTQFHSDGVFVGMSPKFLAGTWVGCFDRRISFNTLRDGQGGKTALPIWGELVKRMQADPAYTSYFNAVWPEEFAWINNCSFTLDESELTDDGIDPSLPRDSTYVGPRRYKVKEDRRTGLGKLLNDIFGKKTDQPHQN